jgi:hypothetical protein
LTKAKLKRSDINFFRYVHKSDLLKEYREDINRSYEIEEDNPFVITVHGEQEDYQLGFNEEGKVWEIEK